jgi:hypothetical protein
MGSGRASRYNGGWSEFIKVFMRLAIGIAVCLFVAAASAVEPTLEERMSKSDFHAAGLDKLSPEELKSLNDWLQGHQATTTITKLVSPSGKPVFYANENREAIESRIDGKFTGWYGKTVFKLENGQEWTQAESGQTSPGKYDHPKVKIKPMLLGSWLMYVEPCGCDVRVERTK